MSAPDPLLAPDPRPAGHRTDGAPLRLRRLGRVEYTPTWQAMKDFTAARDATTVDELWLLEHPPVLTTGLNARPGHLLDPGAIPVVACDRGGQVTYHGPGQVIAYCLFDIARRGLGVQALVRELEGAVIDLLAAHRVTGEARRDAPGVYVGGAKVASLGLRVRRGRSYHGLALNVDMDLAPFARINPCGHPGMPVTRLADLGIELAPDAAGAALARHLSRRLGYNVLN